MNHIIYKVVFSGETVTGIDRESVKQNLKFRFKFDDETMARLFSGDRVTIRKRLDLETANKYIAAFRQEGAVCELVEKPLKPKPPKQEPKNNFLFNEAEPKTVIIDTLAESNKTDSANPFLTSSVNNQLAEPDFPKTVALNSDQTDPTEPNRFAPKDISSEPELALMDPDAETKMPSHNSPFQQVTFTCPKCGQAQVKTEECIQCGIIFAKYNQNQSVLGSNPSSGHPENVAYSGMGSGSSQRSRRSRNRTSIIESIVGFTSDIIQDWFRGHVFVGLIVLVLLPIFGGGLIINAVFYTKDHHVLYELTDRSLGCGDLNGDPNRHSNFTLMDNHQKDYMMVSYEEREVIQDTKGSKFCIFEHKISVGNIGDENVKSIDLMFSPSNIDEITLDGKTLNHTRQRLLNISADNEREHDPVVKHIRNNQIHIENLASGTLLNFKVIGWYTIEQTPKKLDKLLESAKISEGTIEEGSPRATAFARFIANIF